MTDFKHGDICHFEIPARDTTKAKAFYGEVFGWTFKDVPEMHYTLFETPGKVVGGGFFVPDDKMPNKVVGYMLVDSIEATMKKVTKLGGKGAGPVIDVGDMGKMQHVLDPEGNLIALWQAAPRK